MDTQPAITIEEAHRVLKTANIDLTGAVEHDVATLFHAFISRGWRLDAIDRDDERHRFNLTKPAGAASVTVVGSGVTPLEALVIAVAAAATVDANRETRLSVPRATLGERVESMRRLRLMTRVDLANASGVSQMTISRVERDSVSSPSIRTIRKIAHALNVKPAWLLVGDDTE